MLGRISELTSKRGYITGDDGRRYVFVYAETAAKTRLKAGEEVAFRAEGNWARAIFLTADVGQARPSESGSDMTSAADEGAVSPTDLVDRAQRFARMSASGPRHMAAPHLTPLSDGRIPSSEATWRSRCAEAMETGGAQGWWRGGEDQSPFAAAHSSTPCRVKLSGDHPSLRHRYGPIGYVRKCLDLYVDGRGRAGRLEYLCFALLFAALTSGLIVGALVLEPRLPVGLSPIVPGILGLAGAVGLAWFLPFATLVVRRLHDVGFSGWLAAIALVPVIGPAFLIALACLPSERRTNEHGFSPAVGFSR